MQLSAVIFSFAFLCCISHCKSFEGYPPPRPKQGVRFYSGLMSQTIPNYGMISESVFRQGDYGVGYKQKNDMGENDGLNDGLWCQSALSKSNIGKWIVPNGTDLHTTANRGNNVYQVYALGQAGLLRSVSLTKNPSYHMEGVYECEIPADENDTSQTLVLWIAGDHAYEAITEFTISDNVTFLLQSSPQRVTNPQIFSLQFTVNKAPPTYITCHFENQEVYIIDFFRQPLSKIYTSSGEPIRFDVNVTLAPNPGKAGNYSCNISVYRSNGGAPWNYPIADVQTSPVYISVTSNPTNLIATRTETDTVEVTWTASPPPVTGYWLFYAVNGTDKSYMVANTSNVSATITGLSLNIVYKFYVVAYHDAPNTLPSESAESPTVFMNVLNSTTTNDTITDSTTNGNTTTESTTTDSTTTDSNTTDSTTIDSTITDSTTRDSTTIGSITKDSNTTDSTTTDSTTTDSTTKDSTTAENTTTDSTTTDSTITDRTTIESTTIDSTTTDSTTKDSTTTENTTTTDIIITDSTTKYSTTTNSTTTDSTTINSNTTDSTTIDTNTIDSTTTERTNRDSATNVRLSSSASGIVPVLIVLLTVVIATVSIALICGFYCGKVGKKSRITEGLKSSDDGNDNLNSVLNTEQDSLSHAIGDAQKEEDQQDHQYALVSTENKVDVVIRMVNNPLYEERKEPIYDECTENEVQVVIRTVNNPLYEERKKPIYDEIVSGPKEMQERNHDIMTF